MEIFISILLFVIGAMMGSFGCCQVWRIKKHDKSKFSHCMHCKYQLKWYDNVPIISWLALGGRCCKCRKKIGYTEILAEIGMALLFLASFWLWPTHADLILGNPWAIAKFVFFLCMLTTLVICFIYDMKWFELPMIVLVAEIAIAVVFAVVNFAEIVIAEKFEVGLIWSMLGALMILPGLYFLMYKISNERWVGGGDWILNIGLALVLGDFWLGIFAMFLANILGCLSFLPSAIRKKDMNLRIPFGPFLIAAFWIVYMTQGFIFNLVAI